MKRADWPKPPAGYRWLDPEENVGDGAAALVTVRNGKVAETVPVLTLSAPAGKPLTDRPAGLFIHFARKIDKPRKPSPALRIRRLRAALRLITDRSGEDFAIHVAHRALDRDDGKRVS